MKEDPHKSVYPENNQGLEFEKFKYKVELVKWFIGSVTLVIVSMVIEWGFRDRAAGLSEIKEYDKYATELIILNHDPVKKRMLAQYFSSVTPSKKLKQGWLDYYNQVDKEYQAFMYQDSLDRVRIAQLRGDSVALLDPTTKNELQELEERVSESNRIIAQPLILPDKPKVQPIVYIQIGDNAGRSKANMLRAKITTTGMQAPGVEVVESAKGLAIHEIRYFWEPDAIYANMLKSLLDEDDITTVVKFIPAFKSTAKEGTIELWLSSNY
ncbi:hypothetical protein [Lunatimonas salinarum]|uniref:hypothetical protein n=1 Tax=Lunatimonas salinarum TaxID=1774590 RepID=UPI001AE0BBCE|nr:hypothetical protein [Lunatimonas salinarum]